MTEMAPSVQALCDHYRSLESRWSVVDRQSDYGSLVTPTGNASEPIHGWFRFKEAYSHALLLRLMKDAEWMPSQDFSVFDPFAGSGTTLVSALRVAREAEVRVELLGVERNPVMQVVAGAKVGSALLPELALKELQSALPGFWSRYESNLKNSEITTSSPTLSNEDYFAKDFVRSLISLGRAARGVIDPYGRDILMSCVAASVEPAGRLRKDGRALRFMPNKVVESPEVTVRGCLSRVESDLAGWPRGVGSRGHVALGDAREGASGNLEFEASWAVFSPPYPNNIDYTEVYKTEAWALELFETKDDMRLQRLSTLRSHPSIRFPEVYGYLSGPAKEVTELIEPLLSAVPAGRYESGRRQLIMGYVDDMLGVLVATRRAMRPDGRAAIVVGNSAHGSGDEQFVVAADLLIAALAELSGWHVEEIRVARRPGRRPDVHGWLRESVVVLRPI